MKKVNRAKKVKKVDLGAIFDAHVRHEFVDHDVAATMKTMAAEPYVQNVPTLIGGDGHAGVVDFYTHHFAARCRPIRASSGSRARWAGTKWWTSSSYILRTTARLITYFQVFLRPGGK